MLSKVFLVALLTSVAVGATTSVSEDGQGKKAKKKVMRREINSMFASEKGNDVSQSQEVSTLAADASKMSNEQFSALLEILDQQAEEREVLSHSKDNVTMTSQGDITHEKEHVDANVHADNAGAVEVSGAGRLLDHKNVDSLESDDSDEGSTDDKVQGRGWSEEARWRMNGKGVLCRGSSPAAPDSSFTMDGGGAGRGEWYKSRESLKACQALCKGLTSWGCKYISWGAQTSGQWCYVHKDCTHEDASSNYVAFDISGGPCSGPHRRRRRVDSYCANAAEVNLIQWGKECTSSDKKLAGTGATNLQECANLVRDAQGTEEYGGKTSWSPFFIFGIRSKGGACFWEYGIKPVNAGNSGMTWNHACTAKHRWQSDSYNFYELRDHPVPSSGSGNAGAGGGNAAGRR